MFRVKSLAGALWIVLAGSLAFNNMLQAGDEVPDVDLRSMTGTLVCLLKTDDKKGVNAVVSSKPCDGYEPHAHVFVDSTDNNIYSIIATPEKIKELEQSSNKPNIKLFGKIEGSPRGLVFYLN